MLGGPVLQPCGAHDARGEITAVDSAAGLVAVGQQQGPALLFSDGNFGAVIELPLNGRLQGTSALAFSMSGDVLLLGSCAGGLFRLNFSAHGTHLEEVALDRSPQPEANPAPITSIVRQPEEDIFAVAAGRCLYILDASGAVHTQIGPLSESLLQLAWVDGSTLIGGTASAINTWTQNGSALGPVLRNLSPSPYLLFATSPDSRFLAVVSASKEVQCWELGSVLESQATHAAEPIHLDDYEAQVDCLEWDPHSRYLATSDGADVTIWDLSEGGAGCKAGSIACCGHEHTTRVVRMAFCPDGNLLATASNGSKIVLYNVRQFRKGGVVGPAAALHLDCPGDEVTALRWLPGSCLMAGTASGHIRIFQVSPDAGAGAALSATQAVPAAAAAQGGGGAGAAGDSFAQLSLAGRQPKAVRVAPPPQQQQPTAPAARPVPPRQTAPRAVAGSPAQELRGMAGPPQPLVVPGMAMSPPQQQYPPQVYFTSPRRPGNGSSHVNGSGGGGNGTNGGRRRQQHPGDGPFPRAGHEGASGLASSYGSGDGGPRTPANLRGDHMWPDMGGQQGGAGGGMTRQQGGGQGQGQGPFGGGRGQPLSPMAAGARGSPLAGGGPGPEGTMGPLGPARSPAGAGGGSGRSNGNGGPGRAGGSGPPAQSYGMSSSLMQHIQAVRDNPHSARGDSQQQQQRRQQLAGWGAGQPGGMTAMPWMMMVPGGGHMPGGGPMQMPAMAAYPTSAAQAQAQAYAAQYHAAMMQRMAAQGGQPMGPPMQFVPGGGLPTSPRGMPHSPQSAPPCMPATPGGPPMGPGGAMQHAAATVAHPQAQFMVPYMQQWPGPHSAMSAAYPGFMAYPAAASANPAYMAAAMHAMSAMQQHPQPPPPLSPAGGAGGPPRRPPPRQQSLPQPIYPGQGQGQGPPGRSGPAGEGQGSRRAASLPQGASSLPHAASPPAAAAAAPAVVPPEAAADAKATDAEAPATGGGEQAAPKAADPDAEAATPASLAEGAAEDAPPLGKPDAGSSSLEEVPCCGSAEVTFSPMAVVASGDSTASVTPTPGGSAGGSAGDVQSVQGSTQRCSLDGPLSPVGRTSPRLALSIASGGGSGAGQGGAPGGGEGRRRSGQLQRRGSSVEEGEGLPGADRREILSRHLSGSMPGSPASPSGEVVTVYVGNLPAAVDEYTLGCTFMHFGPVMHVQIIRDKGTMVSKGFGFVTFAHPAYATLAMQQMDQQVLYGPFGGLRIKVAPSKQGSGGGGMGMGMAGQAVRGIFAPQQ